MWILRDLTIPKGVLEITTANPNFYLTRFCISALTHIQKHHEEFYTNIENKNSLPQIEPYDLELVKEIQKMANFNKPDFLLALDTLAGEDTSILHQASHLHQDLIRKYPDSFPQSFHRIQPMDTLQELLKIGSAHWRKGSYRLHIPAHYYTFFSMTLAA